MIKAISEASNGIPGEDGKIYYKGSRACTEGIGKSYTQTTGGITYVNGATLVSDWRCTAETIPGTSASIQMNFEVATAGIYHIDLGNMYPMISGATVSVNGATEKIFTPSKTSGPLARWDSVGQYELVKGMNTIRISATGRGYVSMDTIAISRQYIAPTQGHIMAQSVADEITLIYKPLRDATKLSMPKVTSGYKVEIAQTSPSGIIAENGTITRPSKDINVSVKLKVTNTSNVEDVAYTKNLNVLVTSPYVAPAGNLAKAMGDYECKNVGFFVHYVPYLTSGYNGTINDIDELANTFNAQQFANDMAEMGVEYVVFTAWHARILTLFPSKTNKRWRDDRRSVPQSKTYSDRDVIRDLIDALKPKGIDLYLYVHPTDGHDFIDRGEGDNLRQDQELTGFNDNAIWNEYINELYDEMCKRYSSDIKGLWNDGVSSKIDYARLKKTSRAYNPEMIIIENAGIGRKANLVGLKGLGEYDCWEVNNVLSGGSSLGLAMINPNIKVDDGKTWGASKSQVALVLGDGWWSKDTTSEYAPADNQNNAKYAAKDLFLYNVLLASVSRAGGFLYVSGCGNGVGTNYSGGDIWGGGKEGGGNIFATMKEVNSLIRPIEESIKNVNVGSAYITREMSWLSQYDWGVSTESKDRKYVYLHVVNKPSGKTLSIKDTEDGTVLSDNATILNTNTPVSLLKTSTGYDITLLGDYNWNDLDTVIKIQRSAKVVIEDNKIKATDIF